MFKTKSFEGRYLAFAFTGRPNGGMSDCIGGFESVEAAEHAISLMRPVPTYSHIFDTETRELLNVLALIVVGDSMDKLDS